MITMVQKSIRTSELFPTHQTSLVLSCLNPSKVKEGFEPKFSTSTPHFLRKISHFQVRSKPEVWSSSKEGEASEFEEL